MSIVARFAGSKVFGFVASGSVVLAGFFVVNVLNYVFTLVVSRVLGAHEFGTVTALFSLLTIVSVPAAALSMLMAKEIARHASTGGTGETGRLVALLRPHVIAGAVGLWVLFAVLVPFLAEYLGISQGTLFLFSVLVPLSFFGSMQAGIIQGIQEFWVLSKQNILNAAIKLGGSLALIFAGFSVGGVLLALIAGTIVASMYGYLHVVRRVGVAPATLEPLDATITRLYGSALITTLLIALLSNIDVLMAKHYLTEIDAGYYGALSTAGKMLVYAISAFTTILLPMAAHAHAKGARGEHRVLGYSIAIITLASGVAISCFAFAPEFIVRVLFGAPYALVAPELALYGVAMYFVALTLVLVNFFVAVRHTAFTYVFAAGIVLEIGVLMWSHDSLHALTMALTVSTGILVLLLGGEYLRLFRRV